MIMTDYDGSDNVAADDVAVVDDSDDDYHTEHVEDDDYPDGKWRC